MTLRLRGGAGALLGAVALLVLPASGGATEDAVALQNGEIAFIRASNLYGEGLLFVAKADGTGVRRVLDLVRVRRAAWSPDGKRLAIVDECAIKLMPAGGGRLRTILKPPPPNTRRGIVQCYGDLDWSPDGKRLAVVRCLDLFCNWRALWIVEASGKGLRQVTQRECVLRWGLRWCPDRADYGPEWSPDGESIFFSRGGGTDADPPYGNGANNTWLHRVNADGSGLIRLEQRYVWLARFSPDGARIAFSRILFTAPPPTATWTAAIGVRNIDGNGERTLVQEQQGDGPWCRTNGSWSVAWAPDGSRLAYSGPCPQGVYMMNPDGGERMRLTRGRFDTVSDWRALP